MKTTTRTVAVLLVAVRCVLFALPASPALAQTTPPLPPVTRVIGVIAHPDECKPGNPLGVYSLYQTGEDVFVRQNPPCADSIRMGYGVFILWTHAWIDAGTNPRAILGPTIDRDAQGKPIMARPAHPHPGPAGPELFTDLEKRLPGWWAACKKYGDLCRAKGVPFVIYTGIPGLHSLDGMSPQMRTATIDKWARTVEDAGFTHWGLDFSCCIDQSTEYGKTPHVYLCERLVKGRAGMGMRTKPIIESIAFVRPGLHAHFNGRYDLCAFQEGWDRIQTEPGLYPRECWGTTWIIDLALNTPENIARRTAAFQRRRDGVISAIPFEHLSKPVYQVGTPGPAPAPPPVPPPPPGRAGDDKELIRR